MSIEKRLSLIIIVSIIFMLIITFGLFQMGKGSQFNKLNFLHLKHNESLEDLLQENASGPLPVTDIRNVIELILRQPQECLELINTLDLFMMRMIDTEEVYILCVDDELVANKVLRALYSYKQSEISRDEMYDILVDAHQTFQHHSNLFEEPVEKTVNFIMMYVIASSIFVGALTGITLLLTSRGIRRTVNLMKRTTYALAKSEEHNRKIAQLDSLTELPNRNLFQERLKYTIKYCHQIDSSFWLLFIDLDQFKYINDTYGHATGDALLQDAAKRLTNNLRSNDLVARLGGDEFTVILNDSLYKADSDIAIVAKKINDVMSKPFYVNNKKTYITASIGVTSYPKDASDASELLKNADLAMYHAKSSGKNTYAFYNADLLEHTKSRLNWERDIRDAIENDHLEVFYQPVIDTNTLKIISTEALIRWQHPEKGWVQPDQFINITEETRLIIPIGASVLSKAINQCTYWRKNSNNTDLRIAVNVSVEQLKQVNFSKYVGDLLSKSNLPADALGLEITETVYMQNNENCMNNLFDLSDMGIKLYLDDFGTGYSSFSYLHRLPFNVLKIDRSFVPTFQGKDDRNGTIAASITAMSHALGMQVVAEGIETLDALLYFRDCGCDLAQGFLFSPAIPAHELDPDINYYYLLDGQKEIKNTA